jgi:CubicO group peptidase (beta-lactamase class C family)
VPAREVSVGAGGAHRWQDRLADLVRRHDVPGASLSVWADGDVVDAAAGVVNVRTGVEVRPDSPFMIQSITKVLTATLVMQLVDEGLVRLDDPVQRHLPGFRTADEACSSAITLRHLLTHTGGFEGDLWMETTCGPDALARFVDDHVSRAAQQATPGEMYSYCSAGMGVLGRLVEVVRGTTYASAVRRFLTGPLGVEGVAFDAGEALGHRTAIGHVRPAGGAALRPVRTWAVMPSSNPAAGNQLAMPARGLVELARLHLADGLAPTGARLLSTESARMMRHGVIGIPATWRSPALQGLGWRSTPSAGTVEHGGDTIGSTAMLVLVPDRNVAIAMVANGGAMGALTGELCAELLAELAGIGPRAPVAVPAPGPLPDAGRFVGRYELRNRVSEVRLDGDRLWVTRTERNDALDMAARAGVTPEREVTELRRVHEDTFLMVDREGHAGGSVEFIGADAAGRARYLHTGRAAPRAD